MSILKTIVALSCCSKAINSLASNKNVRPLILLDVDGVIGFSGETIVWKDAKTFGFNGFHYSPTVIAKINYWAEHADIKWLTMWDKRAPTNLAPEVGLKHFELARDPYLDWDKPYTGYYWATMDESRPLIWIDDQLTNTELKSENLLLTRLRSTHKDYANPEYSKHQEYYDQIYEDRWKATGRTAKCKEIDTSVYWKKRENTLFIRPTGYYNSGLVPKQLDQVDQFLLNPQGNNFDDLLDLSEFGRM
jgi:hypothetical protein